MSTELNEQLRGSLALVDRRSASLESAPVMNPMHELQMQIVRTGDLEKLRELRAIAKEWREDEAKQAFIEAMAAFKRETIRITKDRENRQYSSRYTSLGNLVETVTPFLSMHGLSADWDIDQTDGIKVACVITHQLGHSKRVVMKVPLDTSGAKNPIQQIKSSITYAKICTFESACGLASTEGGNLDDDGNAAGKTQGEPAGEMDERAVNDHLAAIEAASNQDELQRDYFRARDAAEAAKDKKAALVFAEAKNKQFRKIAGGRR